MRAFVALLLLAFLASPALTAPPERVISIGGALTEIIYALKAEDSLVGSDTSSYYPMAAAQLPKVGYQRTLSTEGVLSLKPDVVLLTEEAGPPEVLQQLRVTNTQTVQLRASLTLDDVKSNIRQIGKLLGRNKEGRKLLQTIEGQHKRLKKAVKQREQAPRIMFVLQHGGGVPLVAGRNTAADSMIHLIGGINVAAAFESYKPMTPEATVLLKPDFILLTQQGLDQVGGKQAFLKIPGITLTPAGKDNRIIVMDALFLLGFGPRTIEAALALNAQVSQL